MARPHLYDRDGNPMTDVIAWARMYERVLDEQRQIISQTEVGHYRVSTIWLGIDFDFDGGPAPLIFETAVFSEQRRWPEMTWHYPNEAAALAGHDQVVAGLRETRVHG